MKDNTKNTTSIPLGRTHVHAWVLSHVWVLAHVWALAHVWVLVHVWVLAHALMHAHNRSPCPSAPVLKHMDLLYCSVVRKLE